MSLIGRILRNKESREVKKIRVIHRRIKNALGDDDLEEAKKYIHRAENYMKKGFYQNNSDLSLELVNLMVCYQRKDK